MGGRDRLSQTRPIPRSPDGDDNRDGCIQYKSKQKKLTYIYTCTINSIWWFFVWNHQIKFSKKWGMLFFSIQCHSKGWLNCEIIVIVIVLVIAKIVLYLWWQEIAVLRKKYFSVVNPPPQTMWPNCVSSKRERPQKMHLRLKIDFLILKTREGLAPSYHYDMIIIADISHYRYHQRKGTFFKAVHFWADITQKMLSRISALLVYFLQAQIMQWCTGIEKYLVCIL